VYEPKFLKRWTYPDNYAGKHWDGYYSAGFGQHRDSDCLARSNFRVALKALEAVSERIRRVRESHWAVGWVEWIAIPADDFAALKAADEMCAAVDSYPVLSDQDHSELEQEEADRFWRESFSPKERLAYIRKFRSQFDFRNFADLLGCVRGKYFAGYASELLWDRISTP
jgi:hypothetical protein